jgi:hypothetical protein
MLSLSMGDLLEKEKTAPVERQNGGNDPAAVDSAPHLCDSAMDLLHDPSGGPAGTGAGTSAVAPFLSGGCLPCRRLLMDTAPLSTGAILTRCFNKVKTNQILFVFWKKRLTFRLSLWYYL